MNIDSMPIIKIEIDRLRQQISAQLGAKGSELGEAIEQRIGEAIKVYPFDDIVGEVVHETVSKSIESFFSHGDGHKLIDGIVQQALTDAFTKNE